MAGLLNQVLPSNNGIPRGLDPRQRNRYARQLRYGVEPSAQYATSPVSTGISNIMQGVFDFSRANPIDAAALAVSPVPVAGDIAGLLNDARHYIQNPETRSMESPLEVSRQIESLRKISR